MEDQQSTTDESAVAGGNTTTINNIPVDEQGQAIPHPEEAEEPAAAEGQETSEAQTEEPSEESKDYDEDTLKWFKSKGIDPSSPEAVAKLAKSAREAERAMHDKAQKASDLEKSMLEQSDQSAEQIAEATGKDPELLKRVQRVEVRDSIRDFMDANPAAKDYEEQIKQKILDSGVSGTAEAVLKAGWAMVLADNTETLKSEGKKEALKTLASKQQAAVPAGNAVNPSGTSSTSKITPQNVDQIVKDMSVEEYQRRLPEINAAMAG